MANANYTNDTDYFRALAVVLNNPHMREIRITFEDNKENNNDEERNVEYERCIAAFNREPIEPRAFDVLYHKPGVKTVFISKYEDRCAITQGILPRPHNE